MTATTSQPSGSGPSQRSLQSAIDEAGNLIDFIRAPKQWDRIGPPDYSPGLIMPQIPYEFSNWEREQRAWRETVALFDQSHHMNGLYLSGPDTLEFVSGLACNALANSTPGRAHQILTCNDDGFLIGDGILFHLASGEMFMCGAPFAVNWVRYNAEHTDLNVSAIYEPRSPVFANGHANTRRNCRYQIQGPNAWALIEKLNGGPLEDVKFFHFTELNIGGHRVQGLRHGMAGAAGLEIWAPWELRDEIRGTIVEAGREFGLAIVGALAYLSGAAEGGWIAAPVPAIFSDSLRSYREWLPAAEMEGLYRLAGSHLSDSIEDFYTTPHDLGYAKIVNLEHEFVGRDALSSLDTSKARRPVSLIWNEDDTAALMKTMLDPDGPNVKPLHLPLLEGDQTIAPFNTVTVNDAFVGFAHSSTYSVNERAVITLATIEPHVQHGDEVVMQWGEAGGGFGDQVVPADVLTSIRCRVEPVPYSRFARSEYRA